jgi:geranylgeranyl diphosphate synthase, type II
MKSLEHGEATGERSSMLEPQAQICELDSHEDLIEGYLADLTFSDDPRLAGLVRAMRQALLSKEERLQAILCVEVACVFGLDPKDVLPAAAAIEFVHTLTSVHADLPALSGYERRQEKPACHEEFGEATAILAGDGFLGTSLALVTTEQKGTPGQLVGVVRELARSAGVGGMIGGQALQASYAGRDVDRETLGVIHDHGTGALFEASGLIGAILAGATPGEREAIARYARLLGICFRIVDDLRSPTPGAARPIEAPEAGASGQAARRTATYRTVYGPRKARLLADETLGRALAALDGINRDTEGLADLAFGVRRGEYAPGTRTRARRGI